MCLSRAFDQGYVLQDNPHVRLSSELQDAHHAMNQLYVDIDHRSVEYILRL